MRIRELPACAGKGRLDLGGETVRSSFPAPASVVLGLVSLLSALSASACDLGTDPAEPKVRSIQVTPGADTLEALEVTLLFTAQAKGKNGQDLSPPEFTWASSDPGVASIDQSGRAVSHAVGSTVITATAEEVTGSANLTVQQTGASVQVVPASDTLKGPGSETQFVATAKDANGYEAPGVVLSWSSSDSTVARVTNQGLATAVGPGRCTITATADGVTASGELIVFPALEGPDPSYRVGAFYYGWYGNPQVDGQWVHWESTALSLFPPEDISSDYYPLLGPYSSNDPVVLARHMAWLRRAGIGVIIHTWWGQGAFSDRAVPHILAAAQEYGIKVAFHMEPYLGRSANALVEDVQYLYDRYGDHPAFFRSTASSRESPDSRPKGVFFLYASGVSDSSCPGGCGVEPEYWADAIDVLHASSEGAFIVGHQPIGERAARTHFDAAYEYVTLAQGEELEFSWALSLPPGLLYVPGVAPGFSARRIRYPEETFLPRLAGQTYRDQWEAAVDPGIEPFMMVVTSFNEWHEGSQIEPVADGMTNGLGYAYPTFDPLPADGYLDLTRSLAEELFLDQDWPPRIPVRAEVATTSDWTWVELADEVRWAAPEVVSVSEGATAFYYFDGRISMNQPLEDATDGLEVKGILDLALMGPCTGDPAIFRIGRGHLGTTTLKLSRLANGQWVSSAEFTWDGIHLDDPQNVQSFQVSCAGLFGAGAG